MAAGQHNPSRRALLGAAVVLSFDTPVLQAHRLLRMSVEGEAPEPLNRPSAAAGPLPRPGEDLWARALVAYREAEGALRECERRTAGAPWELQDEVEAEYGDRLDDLYRALRRLLRAAAPDLRALALKIELAIEHELGTLAGGAPCLAAIRRDAQRLAAAYPGL